MQPHQYALSAGIGLLIILAALPYLFGVARRRAFDQGKDIGLAERDTTRAQQVRTLNDDLAEIAIQREAEQRKHLMTVANLKHTIGELEERIMSYTGMPVTRADYDLLTRGAETLRMAEKTWKAVPGTEPWSRRAAEEAHHLQDLAYRFRSQLRNSPVVDVNAEEAA